MSITDCESLVSRIKAGINSGFTKWTVKSTFPPFLALNRVDLRHGKPGVRIDEFRIILVSPACPAFLVDLEMFFRFPFRVPHFPREVDVPRGKHVIIHQPVNRAFAEHYAVAVGGAYMVDRLALFYKRGHDGVKARGLLLRYGYTLPRLGQPLRILVLCRHGAVEALFQRALPQIPATVAHVWRKRELGAFLLHEFRAYGAAFRTTPAVPVALAAFTQEPHFAPLSFGAVVESFACASCFLGYPVVPDFLGNSGAIFSNFGPDGLEGLPLVEQLLYGAPSIEGQMLVFFHVTILL